MFEAFSLLIIIVITFGAFILLFRITSKLNIRNNNSNIGEVVHSFPLSYKSTAYILEVNKKYYLCCENCGMIEIEYSDEIKNLTNNNTFQSILAKEFSKIKNIKKGKNGKKDI